MNHRKPASEQMTNKVARGEPGEVTDRMKEAGLEAFNRHRAVPLGPSAGETFADVFRAMWDARGVGVAHGQPKTPQATDEKMRQEEALRRLNAAADQMGEEL